MGMGINPRIQLTFRHKFQVFQRKKKLSETFIDLSSCCSVWILYFYIQTVVATHLMLHSSIDTKLFVNLPHPPHTNGSHVPVCRLYSNLQKNAVHETRSGGGVIHSAGTGRPSMLVTCSTCVFVLTVKTARTSRETTSCFMFG